MALRAKPGGGRPPAEDDLAHSGFHPYLQHYLVYRETLGAKPEHIRRLKSVLRRFIRWCDERGLDRPQLITLPILERYQRYLYLYRKADGMPLSLNSQVNFLCTLKRFFQWLTKQHHLPSNPAAELELPKSPTMVPRVILSPEEIDRVLDQPDLGTPPGVRDRAMLEVLYATGIRRGELIRLELHDLDLTHNSLLVREGKGGKDRLVPLGERAREWITTYCRDVRPLLTVDGRERALFLTDFGEAFGSSALANRVKRYLRDAGIDKPGTCHLFRHAMATHMLNNGADIRFIQALLGHAQLTTTEIYTRVCIDQLKQVHAATHPAGRLRPDGPTDPDEADDAGEVT